MSIPLVSIIMPTYNSMNTIGLSLASIARQTLDKSLLEILVIDGGSSDGTRKVAHDFGCRIIDNPRVQPEYAKLLGMAEAKGRYAIFLDSDEVLFDDNSLVKKIHVLQTHQDVKNIITAGLKNPPGYPPINDYTNRFGEPFSFFMYRLDGGEYVHSLRDQYSTWYEDESVLIVEFLDDDILPICDGGGHCFDLDFLKTIADISAAEVVPVVFPRMAQETKKLAVIKNDYTLHYSTTSIGTYLKKLHWRIITNVHGNSGTEGFIGRETYCPKSYQTKKYFFMLYASSLIAPLIDAARLASSHRKLSYLLHFPLTIYTAFFIALQYALKILGVTPRLRSYGK